MKSSQSAATLGGNRSTSAGVVRSLSTQSLAHRPQTAVTTGGRFTRSDSAGGLQSALLYPNHEIRKKASSKAVFGKYARFPTTAADDIVPGPDKYAKEKYVISKIPLGKMGTQSRFRTETETMDASGFDFCPPSFTDRSTGSTFGKFSRFQTEDYVVPGPEYAVVKPQRIRSGKLGKAKRFQVSGDKHDQGFNYVPQGVAESHKGIIFNKEQRFNVSRPTTPGPSAYDPDVKFPLTIVKFSKAHRFIDTSNNDAGYCVNLESFRSPSSREVARNNSSKFGSSERFHEEPPSETTPSVHDYTVNKSTLDKGIRLNKAPRFAHADFPSPGPGDHAHVPAEKIPMGSFHKHPRFAAESDSQMVPGPQYETRHYKEKVPLSGKFNKQKRFEVDKTTTSVAIGPGAYSPKVETTAEGRVHGVVSWRKPLTPDSETGTPGPNYSPSPDKIPGGAIGKTKRFKEPEMRPY